MDRLDGYVEEIMHRADQDGDGLLCASEFMIWFSTEVAAVLPFKRNGMASQTCAPLYNRMVMMMSQADRIVQIMNEVLLN